MSHHNTTHHEAAPHPVHCDDSPSGKHWPRTIEGRSSDGMHTKTSICRHCQMIA